MFLKNRVDFKNKINFNNSNWKVIYIVGIIKHKIKSRGKSNKLLFQEWIWMFYWITDTSQQCQAVGEKKKTVGT